MAAVTVNRRFKEGCQYYEEFVDVTVPTSGDTFQSKFKDIRFVFPHDRTTTGGARCAISSGTVTITCTAGDRIDLHIIGDIN